ncbi:hypothetical protein CN271_08100 [Bacillus cereus]|uniref:response regulator transcription factor n=1 Tax=Bacillus cereus TaxID=1396 RepID=UPI000BEC50E9|nr:response regulator transcription factor [Bacillus cereus]PEE38313.1 hypothetical protein CON59_05480 [Bacillus cereus]PET51317.1 hypothetical protein CN523_03515 [Bacillus cereus]PEV82435.1 hypothetical protein CN429_14560 [Bacillus cereus]PFA56791.1 hypothetical protein CN389_11415 [Bacillus cereus]PFD76843.1 hypothetical protein CN271_08100 [Bacillus cereus]
MKVFLMNSQIMVLDALKQVLNLKSGVEIVGSTTDGKQAIREILQANPEIILSDIYLKDTDGLKLAQLIQKNKLECKIVLISSNWSYNYLQEALKLGIDGILLKDITIEKLIDSLKAVHKGQKVFPTELKTKSHSFSAVLTPREFNIIQLLHEGKTTREIANTLYLSDRTVRNYIYFIKSKLNVKTRIDIINTAIRLGFISNFLG